LRLDSIKGNHDNCVNARTFEQSQFLITVGQKLRRFGWTQNLRRVRAEGNENTGTSISGSPLGDLLNDFAVTDM
jgi:hypothetical protein